MPNSVDISNDMEKIALKRQEERLLLQIRQQSIHNPVLLEIQGGNGWSLPKGQRVALSSRESALHIYLLPSGEELVIPFTSLTCIEISGPGKTESNFGLVGGGFGLEGALKGIASALIVNALTTRTTVKTFIRIATKEGEVFMQTSEIEPDQLRLLLSQAFVTMESTRQHKDAINRSSISVGTELEKLSNLLKEGLLTEAEFSLAKIQLLGFDANKSSSSLVNLPQQPENLGVGFHPTESKKTDKPEIDRQKPISDLFADARAKSGQEQAEFEKALVTLLYEKPLSIIQLMKMSKDDREYVQKLMK